MVDFFYIKDMIDKQESCATNNNTLQVVGKRQKSILKLLPSGSSLPDYCSNKAIMSNTKKRKRKLSSSAAKSNTNTNTNTNNTAATVLRDGAGLPLLTLPKSSSSDDSDDSSDAGTLLPTVHAGALLDPHWYCKRSARGSVSSGSGSSIHGTAAAQRMIRSPFNIS